MVRGKIIGVILCLSVLGVASPSRVYADTLNVWEAYESTDTRAIDHSGWQAVLAKIVHPHADGINRVAYATAAETPNRQALKAYITYLSSLEPRSYNKNQQMAFWINLYNALTVDLVLDYPNKKSIRRMGKKIFSIGPWDDQVISIAGIPLTLNDIEHRILRPIWGDHRIHYAVNCASLGCPNLGLEAYTAQNLERLLSNAEQVYLSHPRGVQLGEDNTLVISSIFDWYRSDFAQDERGVLEYLAKHLPWLARRNDYLELDLNYAYDWRLNSQTLR